ncbi:MAG: mechanosensitive ion channel [Proteobacteria bacterium]|nr:mechanosensitive ion channel [Pseudomonadota bacterium]
MKRYLLIILICIVWPMAAANADSMVEITSDDIILIEPAFSTFVKQKLPFYREKLINLEKPEKIRHLNVEFSSFPQFYRAIKAYFRRKGNLTENIGEFNKEALEIREQIFLEPGLSSSRAIEMILSYKFLKKNIGHSQKTIDVLEKDLDTLFFVLKRSEARANVEKVTDFRSYIGYLMDNLHDLKKEKIDFGTFETNIKDSYDNVPKEDEKKASQFQKRFLRTGIEVSGVFHFATEVENKINYAWNLLKQIYNFELYVMENKQRTIASWVGTVFSVVLLWLVYFVVKIVTGRLISDEGITFMITTLTNYVVAIGIVIVLLNGIGLDPTNITYVISALSVGIGFGMSTIVSNFIAGIILLVERTILVGDKIKLEDGTIVEVERIGVRSSIINTLQDNDIIIPNTDLINNKITNLTYKKRSVTRNEISFTVNPDVDFQTLKKVAVESAIGSLGGKDKVVEKEPDVKVIELATGQLGCMLQVFVDNKNNFIPDAVFKTDLLTAFMKNEIGIFMAPVTEVEIINERKEYQAALKS